MAEWVGGWVVAAVRIACRGIRTYERRREETTVLRTDARLHWTEMSRGVHTVSYCGLGLFSYTAARLCLRKHTRDRGRYGHSLDSGPRAALTLLSAKKTSVDAMEFFDLL